METLLNDRNPLKWERGFLDSFDGRRRYFWHNSRLPWWDVATQLRNHELTRVQRQILEGETPIFHYTTLPALKGIVESEELWLTDYSYLNDSSEIQHGMALARDVFEAATSGADAGTVDALRAVLDTPTERLPRICVACFSLVRDSLTQWKGCARDQVGIAIGIKPSAFLRELAYPRELSCAPVIYNLQGKRDLLRGFLHDWAALRDRDVSESGQLAAYDSLPRSSFVELLSMMKDAAFSDEREVRFVYQEDPEGPIARFDGKAPKRFRMAGHILAPYTTTKDIASRSSILAGTQSRLTFDEITVGPHPHAERVRSGIRELLAESGRSGILVNLSTVPFV